MGGGEEESRCLLGLGTNMTSDYHTLEDLSGVAGSLIVLSETSLGGNKKGVYCRGHKCLTIETLTEMDPHYAQRGMEINDEGILLNLHHSPICYGCSFDRETQRNEEV
ncbi:hypothetical protein GF345_06300 [Candidatus Woesearchaeota archaeon]|nr:hypothetical protein [Candidatus Woesearchaeota archaeon]